MGLKPRVEPPLHCLECGGDLVVRVVDVRDSDLSISMDDFVSVNILVKANRECLTCGAVEASGEAVGRAAAPIFWGSA